MGSGGEGGSRDIDGEETCAGSRGELRTCRRQLETCPVIREERQQVKASTEHLDLG